MKVAALVTDMVGGDVDVDGDGDDDDDFGNCGVCMYGVGGRGLMRRATKKDSSAA